jgi:hypothetical protein
MYIKYTVIRVLYAVSNDLYIYQSLYIYIYIYIYKIVYEEFEIFSLMSIDKLKIEENIYELLTENIMLYY